MRQYKTYINPGLEWIDKIPSHWSCMPLKRYGKFNKGLTFTKADLVEEGHPVVSYGQVHSKNNNGTHLNDELIRFVPDNFIANSYNSFVRKGDFIFADTSEDLEGSGNVVYNDKDMLIYGGYHTVLFQTKNDDNRYLAYLFSTDSWRSQVRSRVSGIKVFSITQGILSMTNIILPPEDEQKVIADYLDEKTTQIDSILKAREKKIQLLEELKTSIISKAVTKGIKKNIETKNSGVAWIGRVPKHWEIRKLKYIAFLKSGDTIPPSQFTDDGYPVYGGNGFRGYTNKFNNEGKHILIGRQGALCGNINYADGKFYASEHAVVVYPHKNENLTWLGELLRISNLNQYSTSAAQPGLAVSNIVNICYPYPPEEERKEIAQYIEKNIDRIEKLKKRAKREIELLKEYRSSLITEVVTGKRKII